MHDADPTPKKQEMAIGPSSKALFSRAKFTSPALSGSGESSRFSSRSHCASTSSQDASTRRSEDSCGRVPTTPISHARIVASTQGARIPSRPSRWGFQREFQMTDILERLARTVAEKRAADPKSSWTAQLLAAGPEKAAQKFGEEAVEAVIEAVRGDRDRACGGGRRTSFIISS